MRALKTTFDVLWHLLAKNSDACCIISNDKSGFLCLPTLGVDNGPPVAKYESVLKVGIDVK
jgi:hypothetical protein